MTVTVSAFLRLIVEETRKNYPQLVPTGAVNPDYIRSAAVPDDLKHQLLDAVYNNYGPQAVLQIGQGLDGAGFAPIWYLLLRQPEPKQVLSMWASLEESTATRFRMSYTPHPDGFGSTVHHFTRSGPPARTTESLLICGVHISIFQKSSCSGLRCSLMPECGAKIPVYENGRFVIGSNRLNVPANRWSIEWDDYECLPAVNNMRLLAEHRDPYGVIQNAASILEQDLTHNWKVDEVASKLCLSGRSLQRYFQQSEASFSLVLRAVRMRKASHLLSDTRTPITDVGYTCGFSDGAHFARDFRKSAGVSPTDYRRVAARC